MTKALQNTSVASLLALAAATGFAQTPTLSPLIGCELAATCSVIAISADGTTVVGQGNPFGWADAPFGFSANVIQGIPPNQIGPVINGSATTAVSADGSVTTVFFAGQTFRRVGNQSTNLGTLRTGGFGHAQPNGISGDGAIVVGFSFGDSGAEAFRWTQGTGMVSLGTLGGPVFFSTANAISNNGQVIVGASNSANGQEAFRWTQALGMRGIGDLPGGAFSSSALAVSSDGSVLVGQGTSANGPEAFIWSQVQGMRGLGALPGGASFRSAATAVSGNGSIVVGTSNAPGGTQAFVWTDGLGLRSIAGLLSANGVNLTGWSLASAVGISADGAVIVGNGSSPGVASQVWIARLGSTLSPTGSATITPIGLTTPESLIQSVANMYSVALSGDQVARADSRRVLDVARRYKPHTATAPARVAAADGVPRITLDSELDSEFYAVGSGSTWNFDPLTQGVAPSLSVGVAKLVGSAWRVGAGLSAQRTTEDTIYNGHYKTSGVGAHAFASWNAGNPGWHFTGVANYLALDETIRRGYVNGAGTSTSTGSTKGSTVGTLIRGEYAHAINTDWTVVPYADFTWTRTVNRAYSEDPASGPFPAQFDRQTYKASVARLGIELEYRLGKDTELFAWIARAERVQGKTASTSGQYVGLGAFNLQNLRIPDSNFIETGVGFSHSVQKNLHLMGSLSAHFANGTASRNAFVASLGVRLGF